MAGANMADVVPRLLIEQTEQAPSADSKGFLQHNMIDTASPDVLRLNYRFAVRRVQIAGWTNAAA